MRTAIITGAGGNLGQAVVKKFLTEGYNVAGTVLNNEPMQADSLTGKYESFVVDLTNEAASENFVTNVFAKSGTIESAVLTVGGFAMGDIASTNAEDIYKQYKLNFETAYHIARPVFIRMLKQQYGRIFIIGSRPGLDAKNSKGMIAYGLGKSLVFRLAEMMNEEAEGKNVKTYVVVPGTIDTPQNRKAMPDADFSKWVKPEEIAYTIYQLSSDEAMTFGETVIKV